MTGNNLIDGVDVFMNFIYGLEDKFFPSQMRVFLGR